MSVFRLSIVLSALCLQGCFDLKIDSKELGELATSNALDVATWSARSIPDVNHDGARDVLLRSSMPAGSDDAARMWILSGRDLTPLVCVAPDSLSRDRGLFSGEVVTGDETEPREMAFCTVVMRGPSFSTEFEPGSTTHLDWFTLGPAGSAQPFHGAVDAGVLLAFGRDSDERGWMRTALIEPDVEQWVTSDWDPEGDSIPFPEGTSPNPRIAAQFPGVADLQTCGDVDDDGALDWLGLTTHPFGIVVISGRDSTAIQSFTFDARQLATVATAGIEMGDVDGDGVSDWLVGAHASESTGHVSDRTCRLGIASLVSGADLHVIRTLERESFLAGPAATCPVVRIPD
jgi:hypothetical protein